MSVRDQWRTDGFVTLRGLYDEQRTVRLKRICDSVLHQWRERDPVTGQVPAVDAIRMQHVHHPSYFPDRKADLCHLLNAIGDCEVLSTCRDLFEEEPLFNCTTLYMNPIEKRRDGFWHRDTQNPFPDPEDERNAVQEAGPAGEMIQIQIALVPSDELEYVSGSHLRWDTTKEFEIRRANGCQNSNSNDMPGASRVILRPGDAVLFNSCGIHRGQYHPDKLRRTLMLTFTMTSRNAHFYHPFFTYQPWLLDPNYLSGITLTAREMFEKFAEIYGSRWDEQGRSR
jgi:hypothetical protein